MFIFGKDLDFETPFLSTSGVITAIWQFMKGDTINIILGILVSISIVILNISKAYKNFKK